MSQIRKNIYKSIFEKNVQLIGEEKQNKLKNAHVAVFGLGGVGSYALEAIVRAGVGTITIIDFDRVEISNINRQLLATYQTIDKYKTDVAEERIYTINPEVHLHKFTIFITKETIPSILKNNIQYAIDAIDTIESKVHLLESLYKNNIKTISCMGAGWKINPSAITIADISKTHTCPLAKIIRTELRKRNITKGIPCVFSKEPPIKSEISPESNLYMFKGNKKNIGSISYLPGIIGLTAGGYIINQIINS
ncbi:MAG: tRNA threonylcarbamoyladenosine dehydratase [Candidatus Hydrogenedens sp.]|nr:tRNA threonylcarbamoyladenosine dehydratase [Candidatus Hydrogenedens sp.]